MESQSLSARLKRHWIKYLAAVLMAASLGILYTVQPNLPSETGRAILANLFIAILLAAFFWPACAALRKWLGQLDFTGRDYRVLWITILVLYAAGFAFLFFYYRAERDIKVYDYSLYWRTVLEARNLAAKSLPLFLREFVTGLTREYTFVPAVPLVPFTYLFGDGYFGYCFSIYTLYYVPACLFLSVFAMRLLKKAHGASPRMLTLVVSLVAGVISVGFLHPLLDGYLDISGVLIAALMLNTVLHWDGTELRWKQLLCLSVLGLLLVLTRRWYAYYIIGFYLSFFIMLIVRMITERKFLVKKLGILLLNIGTVAAVGVLLAFLVNRDIFLQFFGTDYTVSLQAYKNTNVWKNLWQLVSHTGLLWTAVCLAGLIVLLRRSGARLMAIQLIIITAVAVALFTRSQDLYRHHFYLVLPALFIFLCAFCDMGVTYMRKEEKPIIVAAVLALCGINFLYAFVPAFGYLAGLSAPFTTTVEKYPTVRADYDVIRKVTDDLKAETEHSSKLVYVVGEADRLSPELLKRIDLPERIDAVPAIVVNSIVDRRDGFPSQLFLAEYVLMPDSYQNSFSSIQQVSYQVYDMLLHDDALKPYYELQTVYHKGDSDILMFRRVRSADRQLVDLLSQRIREYYPDIPFVYEPNYFLALADFSETVQLDYNYYSNSFGITGASGRSPAVTWHDTAGFTQLKCTVRTESPGQSIVVKNQDEDLLRLTLSDSEPVEVDLSVTGSDFLEIYVESSAGSGEDAGSIFLTYSNDSLT